MKAGLTEAEKETHPARWCLVELENIHCPAIRVEPIHRAVFGIEPGDMLVLLADKKRGIALQTPEKLHPMLRQVFDGMPEDGEDEE